MFIASVNIIPPPLRGRLGGGAFRNPEQLDIFPNLSAKLHSPSPNPSLGGRGMAIVILEKHA